MVVFKSGLPENTALPVKCLGGDAVKNMIPEMDITKTVKAKKLAFGLSDSGLGKARAGWEPRQNP